LSKVYAYLGLPEFEHDFNNVPQVTREDDEAYGIPGLHEIRPRVELLQNDYLKILGRDAVMQAQSQHGWFFHLFGYRIVPV